MKDGEILKCIIAFILGYIVANMWHIDGFSIGAPAGHCKVLTKQYNTSGRKVNKRICSQNNCAYAITNDEEEAFCLGDAECNDKYWKFRVKSGDASMVGCNDKNFAGGVSGVSGVDIYVNERGKSYCTDTKNSDRRCGYDGYCDNIIQQENCNDPCCKWVAGDISDISDISDSDISGISGIDIYINERGKCIDTEDSHLGGCGPDSECKNIFQQGNCNHPCCKWVPK